MSSKPSKATTKGEKTGTKTPIPKTVLDKIVCAIRQLKDPGPKGSSRTSIQKYLKSEYNYDNPNALKRAFKQGVASGLLEQQGQSFRVTNDPIVDDTEEDDEKLRIEDLTDKKKSTGSDRVAVAETGDAVTVAYKGTLHENGYEFDKAANFTFVLGAGDVIKGWDQGIVGMAVGGKRKLIVPPKLGYGKRGCKPDIPPNATLHFIVTLKDIKKS
jgi:FKBP-type peptidyl-prolyl cis-trans isomerase